MNTQLETLTIVVEAKSPFGVLDKTSGKWYNPKSKTMLAQFEVGKTYEVGLEDNTVNGKTYTNIVTVKSAIVESKKSGSNKNKEVPQTSYVSESLPINKDERILVQGLTQALLQSPVMSFASEDNLLEFVESRVVKLVEMVKRLSK